MFSVVRALDRLLCRLFAAYAHRHFCLVQSYRGLGFNLNQALVLAEHRVPLGVCDLFDESYYAGPCSQALLDKLRGYIA